MKALGHMGEQEREKGLPILTLLTQDVGQGGRLEKSYRQEEKCEPWGRGLGGREQLRSVFGRKGVNWRGNGEGEE